MSVDRFRWWLWAQVSKLRRACPAGTHGRIIWRDRDSGWKVSDTCRRDLAANGSCWCGKLRETAVHIGGREYEPFSMRAPTELPPHVEAALREQEADSGGSPS